MLKSLLRDGVGLIGVGLTSYGAWLAWPPAGFIVAGLFLLVGVILHSRPTT